MLALQVYATMLGSEVNLIAMQGWGIVPAGKMLGRSPIAMATGGRVTCNVAGIVLFPPKQTSEEKETRRCKIRAGQSH